MNGKLEGKVAIITGGARGIGKAIAMCFVQEGADIAIIDLDAEDSHLVKDLQKSVGDFKRKCWYKKADVSQMQEVQHATEATVIALGKVNVLVNNAGGSFIPSTPLEDLAETDWDHVINVNLKGTYNCTRAVIRHMKEQKNGKIINVSSRAGRAPSVAANLAYASAKAGVIGFTRQLALDVAPYGINVNAIAPGTVFTERVRKIFEERFTPEERQRILDNIPLKTVAKPEEIGRLAVYLASDESRFVTGATIDINGGATMM